MKKILANFSVIIITAAIAVVGTYALLHNEARSEGNNFSTGNADLKIKMPDTGCNSWSDSCPGKTWTGLYPGWSNSYNVYLKNASAAPITLKIIPYIEETGSSQDLWENTYMEITWSDGSHSSGRYSLEDWKTNSVIELEPRLAQGQEAGPWVVHFDIPETVGNEIANASIEFDLVFDGIQVGEEEENGECETGADCDDGNMCTEDICVEGSCQYANTADGTPCDDGDGCTINDACAGGVCVAGSPLDCDDGNVCTEDSCAGGICQYINNSDPCDDGDACTVEDVCADGMCVGGLPLNCDDGNECTLDSCDSVSGCVNVCEIGQLCDDGNAETIYDVCVQVGEDCLCLGEPCTVYYRDNDDDTYGVFGDSQCLFAPSGVYTATQGGDCDDGNPAINPGAVEICDGLDNDCDGQVDEGDPVVMCPPTANVITTACIAGSCQITACATGYLDSDGIYSNGCETGT